LNTSVTSITHTADSVAIDTSNGVVAVDAVIVATPPRMSASLGALSDAHLANDLATSPIVNIHFVFDRKVTDYSLAAGIDSPIEFIFDRTDASGAAPGQCLVISLSAADRYIGTGSTELINTFHQALCDLLPRARDAKVVSSVVTREHAATFRAAPGVEARRASASSTDPRIFLAGAWCDTGWPATMEGAVRSGNDAASRALSLNSTSTGKGPRNYETVPL
jgi:monoamine oxidase